MKTNQIDKNNVYSILSHYMYYKCCNNILKQLIQKYLLCSFDKGNALPL